MRREVEEEIERLSSLARERGAEARRISTHVVPCRDLEYGKVEHGKITTVGLVLIE